MIIERKYNFFTSYPGVEKIFHHENFITRINFLIYSMHQIVYIHVCIEYVYVCGVCILYHVRCSEAGPAMATTLLLPQKFQCPLTKKASWFLTKVLVH